MKTKSLCIAAAVVFTTLVASAVAGELSPALEAYLVKAPKDVYVPITVALDGGAAPEALAAMTEGLSRSQARSIVGSVAKDRGREAQADILAVLKKGEESGLVRNVRTSWSANAVAADVKPNLIPRLAAFPKVRRVNLDAEYPITCALAWGVEKIGADRCWNELGVTGKDVIVAVADTGVDYEHTDLANRDWVNEGEIPDNGIDDDNNGFVDDYHGWNFASSNNQTRGGTGGHGSHCAGTVCGDGTAGTQTGVAIGAYVMPVQVLTNSGSGTESGCWSGMDYAFDNGADITSMSLGWSQNWNPDRATWRANCETLIAGGMVLVIAAGNERTYSSLPAPNNCRTPGDVPAVITCGSTDSADVYSYFSSYGPVTWSTIAPWSDYPYPPGLVKPDVCAPGSSITSVNGIGGGYTVMSGTSMATPHTAGLAAMVLELDKDATNGEVRQWLEDYALELGTPGKDNDYGSGRIRAYETINAIKLTPIRLSSFIARANARGVQVRWETSQEHNLAGFNLYRRRVVEGTDAVAARVDDGGYAKLNGDLVKGKTPYIFNDADVTAGVTYEYLLEDVDLLGRTNTYGPVNVRASGDAQPVTFWLAQSYPNPARDGAVVRFGVAEGFSGRVRLEIYDLAGRRVATPLDGNLSAGEHELKVDTAALAPGVYVYRLNAGGYTAAKKMVVAR